MVVFYEKAAFKWACAPLNVPTTNDLVDGTPRAASLSTNNLVVRVKLPAHDRVECQGKHPYQVGSLIRRVSEFMHDQQMMHRINYGP
jgi:hypothetical protein